MERNKILNWIIDGQDIDENEYAIYDYGMDVLLMNLIPIISVISLSMFFNCFDYGVIFLLSFIPIRVTIGGFHCSKVINCILIFSILFLITICLKNLNCYSFIRCCGIISILTVWFITPITYDNLDDYDNNLSNAKKTIKLVCIAFMIMIITVNNNNFLFGIYIACILNVLLYFVGKYDLNRKGN